MSKLRKDLLLSGNYGPSGKSEPAWTPRKQATARRGKRQTGPGGSAPGPPFSACARLHNPQARGTGSPSPGGASFTQVEMFESPCLSQEGGQRSPGAPRAGEINHHILLCVSAPDPPSPQSRGQAERLLSNLDARWRQDPVQNATTKSGTRGPTEDFRSSSLLWLQPTQLQDGAATRGRHVVMPPLRETPPPVHISPCAPKTPTKLETPRVPIVVSR